MKLVTKFLLIFAMFAALIGIAGCFKQNADDKDRIQQEKLQQQAQGTLGLPAIINFYEKRTLKMILEKRDDPKVINHLYVISEMTGELKYIGKCVGYPMPYSTQYTNPNKVEYDSPNDPVIPQADPNGLFSPSSAEASWVMLINPETNVPEVAYFEARLQALPFKLK